MSPKPCAARRGQLAERLRAAGGGVALLPTAPERLRNGDSDYPYRHDSHFHHLTGFDEPQAWLVLRSDGHSTLFCCPADPEHAVWHGHRLGTEAAPEVLGVDAALPIDTLNDAMPALLVGQRAVWFPFGRHPELQSQIEGWLATLRAQERRGVDFGRCAALEVTRHRGLP